MQSEDRLFRPTVTEISGKRAFTLAYERLI